MENRMRDEGWGRGEKIKVVKNNGGERVGGREGRR